MLSTTEGDFVVNETRVEIPVRCAHFNSSRCYQALTYRFNRGTLYLEAEHPFHAGSLVFIRTEGSYPEDVDGGVSESFRSVSLAQVISCRKIRKEEVPIRYAITVRYCNPFGY